MQLRRQWKHGEQGAEAPFPPERRKEERTGALNNQLSTAELISHAQLVMEESRRLREETQIIRATYRHTAATAKHVTGKEY